MKLHRRMRWTTIALEKLRRLAWSGMPVREIAKQLRVSETEVQTKATLEGIKLGRRVKRSRMPFVPFD